MPKLIVIGLDDESKEMDLSNTNEKEINKFLIDSIKKQTKPKKEKDNTYLKYYRLKAISGDCAKGGISKEGDFLKIPIKHFNLIKEYLRNQLERELYSVDQDIYKDAFGKLIKKHNDIGNKLIDLKVFHHKWHKRTYWNLIEVE